MDTESTIIYSNARYRDPVIGRFISVDPLLVETPERCGIQECNLYSYTANNPIIFVDPQGTELKDFLTFQEGLFSFRPYGENNSANAVVENAGNLALNTFGHVVNSGLSLVGHTGDAMQKIEGEVMSVTMGLGPQLGMAGQSFKLTGTLLRSAAALKLSRVANASRRVQLSLTQLKLALKSASSPYKGSTSLGHALSKHAGRKPEIWGKMKGNMSTWHEQGMKHFKEIYNASGSFNKVTDSKTGLNFIEKRLSDGRGIRLQMDYSFKGFVD